MDRGQATALLGEWSPQRLWGKGNNRRAKAKKLLQWLNARLSISGRRNQPGDLSIANSISLGP